MGISKCDEKTIVGQWTSKNSRSVGVYVQDGLGPVIALEDERVKNPGHEFAVGLDHDGAPYLQVCKNGEVEMIDLFELVRAVKKIISPTSPNCECLKKTSGK